MAGQRHSRHTRARVIEEYRRVGRVDLACAAAGCDRDCHYLWLKRFPDYKAEFDEAREQVVGLLRDEAFRRAYHGTMRPVKVGDQIHMLTEFSDNLIMFLMKAGDPQYREVSAHRLVDKEGNDRSMLAEFDRLVDGNG